MSCLEIILSRILERKLRLEMGRKLDSSLADREGFLSRGVIVACLKEGGNVDSRRHRLSRLVMGRRRASRHFLSRNVGTMSREHEELLEERMIWRTSSVEVGEKERNGGGVVGGAMWGEQLERGIAA
jgi:hypothetical protein